MSQAATGFAARLLNDGILAMTLLTRIPMPPARTWDAAAQSHAVWAYPIVGAMIGAIGAIVFWAARNIGLPANPAAWSAVAAMILATGCFHEDGLADFWDGIGGGQTITRKLEIMRDSRIGSYGAAALITSLGLRTALIAALDTVGSAEVALIAAGLLGRCGIVAVLHLIGPARADGLAATAAAPPALCVAAAMLFGVSVFWLCQASAAVAAIAATGIVVGLMTRLMRHQIEGYTGDGLGATEQKIEGAVLAAVLACTSFT
jgi:adenosylcobinamide-GDP ribazoletransferase